MKAKEKVKQTASADVTEMLCGMVLQTPDMPGVEVNEATPNMVTLDISALADSGGVLTPSYYNTRLQANILAGRLRAMPASEHKAFLRDVLSAGCVSDGNREIKINPQIRSRLKGILLHFAFVTTA